MGNLSRTRGVTIRGLWNRCNLAPISSCLAVLACALFAPVACAGKMLPNVARQAPVFLAGSTVASGAGVYEWGDGEWGGGISNHLIANQPLPEAERAEADRAEAGPQNSAHGAEWVSESGALFSEGAVCGVYSLAAALSHYDVEIDVRNYLNDQYVVPRYGSSVSQLAEIARQHDVTLVPLQNMDINGLCATGVPALLNLRSGDYEGNLTGHWIAFLGTTGNGRYRIYDPFAAERVHEVSGDALNANWAGDVLLVTRPTAPTGQEVPWVLAYLNSIVPVGLMVVLAALFPRFVARMIGASRAGAHSAKGGILAGGAVFLAGTICVLLVQHATGLAGPTDPAAIHWVAARHQTRTAPQISFDEFCGRLQDGGTKVVDARNRVQFQQLRIAGSENLPASGTLYDFADWIERTPRDCPIVVLCVSENCEWDQVVANRLLHAGFRDVTVFNGGISQCFYSGRFEKQNEQLLLRK